MSASKIPPAAIAPTPIPKAIAAVLAFRSSYFTSCLVSAISCSSKSLASLAMPLTNDTKLGASGCCDPLSMPLSRPPGQQVPPTDTDQYGLDRIGADQGSDVFCHMV